MLLFDTDRLADIREVENPNASQNQSRLGDNLLEKWNRIKRRCSLFHCHQPILIQEKIANA